MAYNIQILVNGFVDMNDNPVDTFPEVGIKIVDVYEKFIKTSSAGPLPLLGSASSLGRTAFLAAFNPLLTSVATPFSAALQAGIIAFWGALAAPGAYGPTCLSVAPPPGLAGISASLLSAFAANTNGRLDKFQSAQAIANIIMPAHVGGVASIQAGAAPVPTPIV